MTEQEAFENWITSAREESGGVTPTRDEVWHAAIAWLRSQGEPAVWMYEQDGMVHDGMYPPLFLQKQRPLDRDDNWTETPLYLAPQPKYVPVDASLRNKNWNHPNDDERLDPLCRDALRDRGNDVGQGLDGFWKWGFKAGGNACLESASAAPQPVIPDGWQSVAARDVLSERRRQMEKEGWTLANDDEHRDGSMAQAAACYALGAATDNPDRHVMDRFGIEGTPYHIHSLWPWDRKWFKPHSRRRDLVKAGALILAEVERLDRRMLVTAPK